MNKETLLTPEDVRELSGFDPNVEICQVSEIYNIEYRNARGCLGYDLWVRMIEAKADYSSAEEYEADTTYNANDVVIFRGVYRMANKTTNNVPTLADDWDLAPKFDGDGKELFEEIYSQFVGPYLALTILAFRLPFVWTRIESTGVVMYNGAEMKSADSDGYDRLLGAIHRDRNDVLANLNFYVDRILDGKNPDYSKSDATTYLQGFPSVDNYLDGNGSGCGSNQNCNNGRKVSRRYRFG